jgi:hypothetical protein
MNPLDRLKQAGARSAFKGWLNHRYSTLGSMTHLHIDPSARTIQLELQLKGEATPIRVELGDYTLTQREGKTWLRVGRVETSREWLTVLGREWLVNREIELPELARLVL